MHQLIDSLNFNLLILELDRLIEAAARCPRIKRVNLSAAALLGYSRQELIDKPLDMLYAPENMELWQTAWSDLTDKNAGKSFECELVGKAHNRIQVFISLSVLPGQHPEKTTVILLIQDISDRKRQDKDLFMMHRAVEQSASAVMITDHKGRIEYINPKFTELTGYTFEELQGQNPRVLQSGSTTPQYYRAMLDTLFSTGEWCGEIKNKKKNGEDYWAYESISAIKNSQGATTHFVAVEEDITQRKAVESALTESEQRFRQMADMTGEWLWEQDPNGYYIYCSTAVNQIIGYSQDEVTGKHYTEFLTPQDKASQQNYSTSHRPFYALTNHYQHKDGHAVLTESTGLPIIDAEGKLLKWRGVDRDITARQHFQDALVESEKRMRLIIDSSLNAIVLMDSYGIITDWNPCAEKMFGWSPNEAIGQILSELIIPPRFRKAHQQGLQHFLHTGIGPILNQLIEHVAIRRDGSEFPVELSISPLKLGNAYIFSGFIHDITGRRRLEHRFRQAVESAPNAIIMVNESGTIVMVNAQTETFFGYARTELMGQSIEILVPERFRSAHIGFRHAYLAAPVSRSMGVGRDLFGLRKDGTEFPVEIGLSLIDSHEETLVLTTIVDITARKAAEQQIRQAQINLAIAQSEINIAHQIQASLLPAEAINSEHFEVTGYCLPADQVGGDYFDYFFRGENHLDMVIADVSGHSIGPALFMVEARSAIRTQANSAATPAQTLKVLNNFLYADLNHADYFITLSYLQYDINQQRLTFANAGHPPPMLVQNQCIDEECLFPSSEQAAWNEAEIQQLFGHQFILGEPLINTSQTQCTLLDAEGLILGVREHVLFEEKYIQLNAGDLILLYTDGLTEAENPQGEFFGTERLRSLLLQCAHKSPHAIINTLMEQLKLFCQNESFKDDITLMIFKRK